MFPDSLLGWGDLAWIRKRIKASIVKVKFIFRWKFILRYTRSYLCRDKKCWSRDRHYYFCACISATFQVKVKVIWKSKSTEVKVIRKSKSIAVKVNRSQSDQKVKVNRNSLSQPQKVKVNQRKSKSNQQIRGLY